MSPLRPTRTRLSLAVERAVELAVRACGWSAIAFVFAIIFFVFREAAPLLLGGIDVREFVTSANWRPESVIRPQFGSVALLAGTLSVTSLAMLLSIPAGFGAAVFVSEFCGPRSRETLKVVIELLAAIPSVVWGFIGYMVLNPLIIAATGAPIGLNVLNGALILAFMSVPIVMSMGEDALNAVPDAYREAALALGASRWQLIRRVLLPGARKGLLAAALLGIGRAIGETMAVLMATGHSLRIPHSVFDPVRTLTATIAAELGETVSGGTHYRTLFLIGAVLLVISLVINVTADLVVSGRRRRRSV
jgi:phosphate transport system permease protein